ncbi:MAG: hypothetical protein ACXABF_05475 [Candidatus Thorarchaeota archaeon]
MPKTAKKRRKKKGEGPKVVRALFGSLKTKLPALKLDLRWL